MLKHRILFSIAKFGGKSMFAAMKLNGTETMTIIEPSIRDVPIVPGPNWPDGAFVGEVLMEFPQQASF